MKKAISRFWVGAALVTLCMTMTIRAVLDNRITETAMYMVATFFAVALAYASVDHHEL